MKKKNVEMWRDMLDSLEGLLREAVAGAEQDKAEIERLRGELAACELRVDGQIAAGEKRVQGIARYTEQIDKETEDTIARLRAERDKLRRMVEVACNVQWACDGCPVCSTCNSSSKPCSEKLRDWLSSLPAGEAKEVTP